MAGQPTPPPNVPPPGGRLTSHDINQSGFHGSCQASQLPLLGFFFIIPTLEFKGPNSREKMPTLSPQEKQKLGGGFKYFLFSSLLGEDSHFDEHIFSDGLVQPPTRKTRLLSGL